MKTKKHGDLKSVYGVCEVKGRRDEGGGAVWLTSNPLSLVMSWDQANPTFTD